MRRVSDCLKGLLCEDAGQDLIEYALVAGLIALGAVIAMSGLATKIGNGFNNIGSRLANSI
jgi:pilus assembly protein Flp/PilA